MNNDGISTEKFLERAMVHYRHARDKHPYFADRMYEEQDIDMARQSLKTWRTQIQDEIESGNCCAETLLNCELCEVAEAYFSGDKAKAVEECYDAIAVILRMVDVLEGRQTLGNPNKDERRNDNE